MLSNLKIAAKLNLLVGLLVMALLGIGGYAIVAPDLAAARQAESLAMKKLLLQAQDLAGDAGVAFKIQVQEWKNILLRGHDAEDYQTYLAALKKREDLVSEKLAELDKLMAQAGVSTAPVAEARRLQSELSQQYRAALDQFQPGVLESSHRVDRLVRGKDRPVDKALEAIGTTLQQFATAESERLASEAAAASRRDLGLLSLLVAVVAALAALAGLTIARSISGPIRDAVAAAERVADGDLSVRLEAAGRDETAQMLHALARMAANLRALVGDVAEGARTVAHTSAQIAQGSVDLSQRTEEQAGTLEETASSMEELTSTVGRNAETARKASQLAVDASEVARKGGQAVGEVVRSMSGISESSRKIGDIIGVIDGIAFQTNILALNAAVEAARAGEQGRGFAVVASEVRTLAQRSAAAAKEIKELIGESVGQVEAGNRQVDAAGRTMEEIVVSVRRVSDLIAEIAAATQEQSSGIEQVNTAITQMDQVVQQNASLVEEAAAATESMKEQAQSLLRSVARFHLGAAAPAGAGRRPEPETPPVERPAPVALAPALPVLGTPVAALSSQWREF